jgi:fluoride ion exporter CrcB/FEX
MFSSLPTYAYPFIFAVLAAAGGWYLSEGRPRDDSASLPAWILFAVALGCVVIGFATMWLSQRV